MYAVAVLAAIFFALAVQRRNELGRIKELLEDPIYRARLAKTDRYITYKENIRDCVNAKDREGLREARAKWKIEAQLLDDADEYSPNDIKRKLDAL